MSECKECEWIVSMTERWTTSVTARTRLEAIAKAEKEGFGGTQEVISVSAKRLRKSKKSRKT